MLYIMDPGYPPGIYFAASMYILSLPTHQNTHQNQAEPIKTKIFQQVLRACTQGKSASHPKGATHCNIAIGLDHPCIDIPTTTQPRHSPHQAQEGALHLQDALHLGYQATSVLHLRSWTISASHPKGATHCNLSTDLTEQV